ncbi:MAG: cysteine rich repeat-containing protein [Pseudomonadota bacterium]
MPHSYTCNSDACSSETFRSETFRCGASRSSAAHHVERRLAAQAFLIVATCLALTAPVASQQPTQAQRDAIRAACRSDYEAHCASVQPGGKAALMCLQKNMASLSQPCQRAVNAVVGAAAPETQPVPASPPPASSTAAAPPALPAPAAAPSTPAAPVASPATQAAPSAAPPAAGTAAKAAAATGAKRPSQAQVGAIRAACRGDYQAVCAGVPTGGAAALNCLQKNAATLSAPCRQAVDAAGGAATASEAPAASGAAAPAPMAGAISPAMSPTMAPAMSPREEIRLVRVSCGRDFRMLCGDVPPGGGRVIACLRANEASLSPRCQSAMAGLRR